MTLLAKNLQAPEVILQNSQLRKERFVVWQSQYAILSGSFFIPLTYQKLLDMFFKHDPLPGYVRIWADDNEEIPLVSSMFGVVPRGSVTAYQHPCPWKETVVRCQQVSHWKPVETSFLKLEAWQVLWLCPLSWSDGQSVFYPISLQLLYCSLPWGALWTWTEVRLLPIWRRSCLQRGHCFRSARNLWFKGLWAVGSNKETTRQVRWQVGGYMLQMLPSMDESRHWYILFNHGHVIFCKCLWQLYGIVDFQIRDGFCVLMHSWSSLALWCWFP